jgi:hypothetical protein
MRRTQVTHRLALRKQTLRALTANQLSRVAGGTGAYEAEGGGSGGGDDTVSQGPGGWSNCCNCL